MIVVRLKTPAAVLAVSLVAAPAARALAPATLDLAALPRLLGLSPAEAAARRPAGLPERYVLSCSPSLSAAQAECAWRERRGAYTLRPDLRLAHIDSALDGLRLRIGRGRVVAVSVRLPIDDFNTAVARLDGLYGAALATRRTRVRTEAGPLPQVIKTWRMPQGEVKLVAPSPPRYDLEIIASGAGPGAPE